MAEKFKAGDLVELKSGGPVMTVESINTFGGNTYACSWFAGDKHQENRFAEAALKLAEADE